VRVHLIPSLGHLKLKELTREHIQHLYTTKRGEGLSAGTVRRIHAVLSSAFSRAVRLRLVKHNICQDADPPRSEVSEICPLNQKEARSFLKLAEGEGYSALYCLASTRRSIKPTTKAVDALVRHQERQCEAGFSVENDALVFTSTKGTPINTSRLRLAFKAFLKRSGLPDIRFQDLRHTYVTLLLSKGIHPKKVANSLVTRA
jgi:integrase